MIAAAHYQDENAQSPFSAGLLLIDAPLVSSRSEQVMTSRLEWDLRCRSDRSRSPFRPGDEIALFRDANPGAAGLGRETLYDRSQERPRLR